MTPQSCRRFRFLIPFAALGFLALFTFAVYALWNGVLVDVLPVKAITFWQALGLLVLAKILFGGFPCRGGKFGGPPWREHMLAHRWRRLSPEQREEMRHRFGDWPRPPWADEEDAPTRQPKPPTP